MEEFNIGGVQHLEAMQVGSLAGKIALTNGLDSVTKEIEKLLANDTIFENTGVDGASSIEQGAEENVTTHH